MIKVPDGTIRVLVQATERVRIGDYVTEKPYLVARIEALPDVAEKTPELEALTRNVQRTFSEIIEQIPYLPEELQLALANVDDPSALSHLIAGSLQIPTVEKQALLEEVDVTRRLRRLAEILARELEVIQLGTQIQSEVESELGKGQREFYLREQLKAIQRELGEDDPEAAELAELRTRIEEADLPEHALQGGRPRARAPRAVAFGGRRARRHPHLPRVARRPAVGGPHRRQPRPRRTRARSSTPTTTTSSGSRTGSSSTSRSAHSRKNTAAADERGRSRTATGRSSASSAPRGSARRASGTRSRRRSAAPSSGSRSAACATRPRSAATAAPTSARCRGRSSARCATPARATRCS